MPPQTISIEGQDAELAAHSRRLRNNLITLAVFFMLVIALLLAVPGLRSVAERITDAQPGWVALAIALEVLSCAGYVVLFRLVFGRLGRALSYRLSLAELAVNSVVSAGGIGGLALGAWVLRSKGVSVERVAKRSVLLFVLTSAVNVGAVVVIGIPMWLGLLEGSRNPLLTLLPGAARARDDPRNARRRQMGAGADRKQTHRWAHRRGAHGRERWRARSGAPHPRARLAPVGLGGVLAV